MAKGGTIKGIILEIGADTSGLQKALSKVNSNASSLSKELRGVNSLLKLDPKNVELLDQKQTILNESIETTQDKLNQLKKIKEEADKKMSEGTKISEENYRNLQREIINTQNKLNGLTDELKQFNAQNSNWTKAGKKIQEYGNNITKASEKIDEIGNKTSVVSAGVVAGGTALVNSAMNLEDAVAKYVSSTNTAEEETQKYKQVLENINNNNYGEGYEDIANSMTQVKMQLKNINEQDLQNITEKAIALRDLFGYDVSESVRAVKAMMDNLNVSADEAFNLIAEGKKQGLDFSNELLDNVNEYSVQFGKLGLSAQDMFNIFKVGADNGAFNLDKIGDAVKEFSIRAIDGSNTTIDGFKRIGLNADDMAKKFAGGGEAAKQAFIEVVNRLGSMDDKVSQSIAGVDLFGTMWEDLGPTVVTSFSKMDNGISQSSDSMQKSIDQLYNTTKKKAETQLKRLQSLGADFGEEMLPVLEDLIDIAEKFIDKLDGMSDAEKENIVKIGLLVAGAGPLIKTMGTVGKVIGNVTNGIGIFSQAIGIAKTGANSTNATINSLAKNIGFLTTPTGLATTAIIALTTAYAANYVAITKEKAALGGLREEVETQKETWNQLKSTRDTTLSSSLAEIETTQKLADELKKITDENGKVKQGYEDRAQVILNQLNGALGTEYQLNGDIIGQYQELKNNIDNLIASKKAEAVLNAYQEEYGAAIKGQAEATETLVGLRKQLAETSEKITTSTGKERKEAEILYSSIAQQIGEQTSLISEYGKTIVDVENLQTASVTGSAEEIDKAITQIGTSYERANQQSQQSIEQQIQSQTEYIKYIKESLKDAEEANDTYQRNVLNGQLETEQKKIESLTNSLVEQTSTIEELTPGQLEAWKNIVNLSFNEYSKGLMRLPEEVRNKIQESTGVIALDTTMQTASGNQASQMVTLFSENLKLGNVSKIAIDEATDTANKNTSLAFSYGNLGTKSNDEFKKEINYEKGKSATTDYMSGAEEGGNNSKWSFWDLLFGIGKQGNQKMRDGLGDGSPSVLAKKAVIDYFLGAEIGAKKQGPKVVRDIEGYAKQINQKFGKNLEGADLGINNKLSSINSKIINGTKTVFTTPTLNIYTQGELDIRKVADEVNKIFGSQY